MPSGGSEASYCIISIHRVPSSGVYIYIDIQVTHSGSGDGLQRLLGAHLLHGGVVLLLVLGHKHLQRSARLLLLLVKVVDDDTNKQVEREERPEDDEEHEVKVHVDVDLPRRLLVHLSHHINSHQRCHIVQSPDLPLNPLLESYFSRIGGVAHDMHPALEGGHLEQGQVGHAHVVKVHGRVLPRVVGEPFAVVFIFDDLDGHDHAVLVDALHINTSISFQFQYLSFTSNTDQNSC